MARSLKIIALFLALLLIAAVTLPWWIAPAASPLLARQGITLQGVRAKGLRTLEIEEARLVRGGTTVVVRALSVPSPWRWLAASGRRATAKTWSVTVQANAHPASPHAGAVTGLPSLHAQLEKIVRRLNQWLPAAAVEAGEVRWPGGELTLASASWQNSVLTGRAIQYRQQTVDLTITAASADQLVVEVREPRQGAQAKLVWCEANVEGSAAWWDQPIKVSATFPVVGWWPEAADIHADNWSVPADRLGLAAQYSHLTGQANVAWRDGHFNGTAAVDVSPKAGQKAPPLQARVEATGDRASATLRTFRVDAPFARATLAAPLAFSWETKTVASLAALQVEADLSQQPWFEATGRVTGSLTVSPNGKQRFALQVAGLAYQGFTLQQATAKGFWDGRALVMESLDLQLDDATQAKLAGQFDWEKRELRDVTFEARAQPAALQRWLPPDLTWRDATAKGSVRGALDAPQFATSMQLNGLHVNRVKTVDATLTARGEGRMIDAFTAVITAEKSSLQVAGNADARGVTLSELHFAPAGTEQLALVQPVRIEWSPAFQIGAAKFQGPTATLALEVAPGPARALRLEATHLDKEWIHDWLDLRGPTWRVQHLAIAGQIEANALAFTTSLQGELHLPGRDVSEITLTARGDQTGITLTGLKIVEGNQVLTEASGQIGASWLVDATPHLRLDQQAPLALQATALPTSPLWAALGEPAGITAQGASAEARLSGTLAQPLGELRVEIAKLVVEPDSRWRERVPEVSDLALAASGTRAELRVDSFRAAIEGQAVRAQARVPMAAGRWRQLVTAPAKFDWREIEGQIEVPAADLGALAKRFPQFFAARGSLRAAVALARGGQLSGSLNLQGVATPPLPALGVVQDITAEIRFADRTARIESFAGMLGGEPVQLEGSVALPHGEAARPDLHLTGKNLPLVRKAGLLVRADLDLRARTEDERTSITGVVNLRDALVLADFSDLFPTGVRGAKRPPPYFSVEAEPFNRWGLAVELRGASAVRMRTPFFTGSGSAHFKLSGNLGEPRAIGEVTVENGRVFFPFATFTVQNGAVRLKASDPFTPALALNALSRRHNYELRLEVTGQPDSPIVQFSANPALDAGQVLLMVMAGQIPANETTGTPGQGGLQLTQLGAYLGQGIYRGLGGSDENRLEIVSGERVSRDGRETYGIEYKLGEHWSLVGEYDEFDAYNAGLKWRVYTQEGGRAKK